MQRSTLQKIALVLCVVMVTLFLTIPSRFPSLVFSTLSASHSWKGSFSKQYCPPRVASDSFRSAKRGHIAILYSGTVRSFTLVFHSHLINLIIPSPYPVHIFAHASTGRFDWKTPSGEHHHTEVYRGFNATIDYYNAYDNIDNERVSLTRDVLKYVEISNEPLDMNINAYFNYTEIFRLIGKRHDFKSKPASVTGQLDSLRRANQARLNYERANNIKYQWIVRLRMDHLMKTNIWEDFFSIKPLNISNPDHRKLLNQSLFESTQSNPNLTNRYWNGGVLYDMVYIPRQDSNLTSIDHEISLFVPTCEWWSGVTDQFAIGGSIALTKYSERLNVPLIRKLAKEKRWIFWAEPFLRQSIEHEKLPVYKLRHVYNVIRIVRTNRSRDESTFTASRCIYIWYGGLCHRNHCPSWIDQFTSLHTIMLNRSQQHREHLLQREIYANSGPFAQEGFNNSIKHLHFMYGQIISKMQQYSVNCLANQSNYFYFWRHRSPKQMLQCIMPAPVADSVRSMLNPQRPLTQFTPFDIFAYHFYPFITLTTDPLARHRYKQSLVCVLE